MKRHQEILYAFDCGSTNWRIVRLVYEVDVNTAQKCTDPLPISLRGFKDNKLPAVLLLTLDEKMLKSYGIVARGKTDSIDGFKPSIGTHNQKKKVESITFTRDEALKYTRLLLKAVLEDIKAQYEGGEFRDDLRFSFAYPAYWEGDTLTDFKNEILDCFDERIRERVRFVPEPEAALLYLEYSRQVTPQAHSKEVVLIVDVGGSTTDLIAGEYDAQDGSLKILGTDGMAHGGMKYDQALVDVFLEDLKISASDLRNNPDLETKLRAVGEELKEQLSDEVSILRGTSVSNVHSKHFSYKLSDGRLLADILTLNESKFRNATQKLTEEFEEIITNGLAKFNLEKIDVTQVVLVGGGVRLFTVEQSLKKRFEKVIKAAAPDEAVVRGTALDFAKAYPARIEITPKILDFGVIREHEEHQPLELYLQNDGIASIDVEVQTLTNALQVEPVKFTLKEGERKTCCVRLLSMSSANADLQTAEVSGVKEVGIKVQTLYESKEVIYRFLYALEELIVSKKKPKETSDDLSLTEPMVKEKPASAPKKARLVSMQGISYTLKQYNLVGRGEPNRASEVDVNLASLDVMRIVSRRHATIIRGEKTFILCDNSSRNGTWLNNKHLSAGVNTPLKHGDEIIFGTPKRGGVQLMFTEE